jgi:hypothetical protein
LISDGEGGLISALALETARLASDLAGGDELTSGEDVGAGDAVEVRDRGVFLIGEDSVAGKSPCGCDRVETMMAKRDRRRVKVVGNYQELWEAQWERECNVLR